MLHTVKRTMLSWQVVRPGQGILVAVSGGPDSLALLEVLSVLAPGLGIHLEVAHLDHGLRGKESEADARFVEREAGTRGLAFHHLRLDVGQMAARWKTSVQDAAHRLRHGFLERVRRRQALAFTALGHHMDDQAETLLLHFLRGAGPDGLSGLRPVDGHLIRPLLDVRKSQIDDFLKERGIEPRVDPSNQDRKYTRNLIRLDILPVLERDLNPALTETLAGSARIMADVSDYLDEVAATTLDSLAHSSEPLLLPAPAFTSLHPAVQQSVIRLGFSRVAGDARGLKRRHVEAVRDLWLCARPGSRLDLPRGTRAWVEESQLALGTVRDRDQRQGPAIAAFHYEMQVPGTLSIPEADLSIEARVMDRDSIPPGALSGRPGRKEPAPAVRGVPLLAREVYIDYNKLDLPLVVRNRRPGDWFRPLNLGGTVKVKDFFISNKIQPGARDLIPLVYAGDRLVWIAGFRLDDQFKVNDQTTSVVRLRVAENRGV